jgi:hypothetical protein
MSKVTIDDKWRSLPALRAILENKELSVAYCGPTSVSDNAFDGLQRALEISLLVCECQRDIIGTAQAETTNPLEIGEIMGELRGLHEALCGATSFIEDTRHKLERLSGEVHASATRRDTQRYREPPVSGE